jgi:bifunctional DNase/RNase
MVYNKQPSPEIPMANMIEVQIDSVRVHLMTPNRLVVLKQLNSERYLPIWVGPYEAEAITIALQEVEVSRPLTHDLLRNIFAAFNGKELRIDSRSSDAIALSVRAHVPIFVHPSVMDAASILPEEEVSENAPPPPKAEPAPLTKEGVERLSVFENFLEKLDFDKPDEGKPQDDAPDKPKKPKKK